MNHVLNVEFMLQHPHRGTECLYKFFDSTTPFTNHVTVANHQLLLAQWRFFPDAPHSPGPRYNGSSQRQPDPRELGHARMFLVALHGGIEQPSARFEFKHGKNKAWCDQQKAGGGSAGGEQWF